jgi:HD superfamily phosphohydrolase
LNLNIEDLLGAHHKLIMDPIHGGIPLLTHEVLIVDHPLFQRLRFICQNDILSLVFPGATHSRFLHSVGTMHVGGRIFNTMIENSLKQRSRLGILGVSSEMLEAISFFKRLVRCACLLHDSGHSSFSHQFNRTPTIKKILAEPGRFETLWQGIDFTNIYTDIPKQLEHEHFSVRAAYQILTDIPQLSLKIPVTDILSLMDTTEVKPSADFTRHAEALWPLVNTNQVKPQATPTNLASKLQRLLASLVSGELDADRADYMLRDGFHSSVTIGGFNLDHLLSNLHFGWCEQTEWCGLAIAHKGLGSLEDFVYSRHQMYRQVYAHKTAQGFDWLLRAAIDEVMTQENILSFVTGGLSDIQNFKHLTDSYFWEAFRQYAETHKESYSQCIIERIKMPYLASRENLSAEEEQHYLTFLAKEHNCLKESLVSSSITARFTKIRDDYSGIKVLFTDYQSKATSLRLISDTSQFFGKFTDERITHFYINPVPYKR